MADPLPAGATKSTAPYLRFHELTPAGFQSFCRDLVKELPRFIECHQYGVEGDEQGEIDLVATTVGGANEGIQCRRVKKFGPADLRKLAKGVTYEAKHYYTAIACRATKGVRDEELRQEKWTVWDADDISSMVRALPQEVARRLVRTHFGADAVRDFLGLHPFSSFVLGEEFFKPLLDPRKIFNHAWQLVGRTNELSRLRAFLDSEKLIYVLPGRGGMGKSKILHAFSETTKEFRSVYFAQPGVTITVDSLTELPIKDTLIIVDDAHRREDLGVLFTYAARTRNKVLLSTRPQLDSEIPSLAAKHQIGAEEILRAEALEALTFENVVSLAREVLGPDFQHMAEALAEVTRDCALITVVGGALLRDEHVPPTLLSEHEKFRETALGRFFDEIVEHAEPGTNEEVRRRLLSVVAALAPVHPASERFAVSVAELTKLDRETAERICEMFAAQGILVLQESGYRIVPDVLSDYVLGVACEDNRFVKRIVASCGSFDPALLRNLAAVDWRMSRKTGEELSVLGSVWPSVVSAFEKASNSERSRMLRDMKEVAIFLPHRMLELARLAVNFPSATPESGPLSMYLRTSHEDVLAQLPEVIRPAMYHPETFDGAADFLWRIALQQRSSKHPTRVKDAREVLSDTMSYGLQKPRWMQEGLLSRVETWQSVATTAEEKRALPSIVAPLFMKTGTDYRSHNMSVNVTSFTISREATDDLRRRGLQIVDTLLHDADRSVVGRAVKALTHAVQPPLSLGGLLISDEFYAACEKERLEALGMLKAFVTRNPDGVIASQVTDIVSWYANEDGNEAIRTAASEVLGSISGDASVTVAVAVHDPWGHRFRPREETAASQCVEAAARAIAELTTDDAVRLLSNILDGLSDLDMHATPHVLLGAVARSRPDVGGALFAAALTHDGSFTAHAASALGPLHSADPDLFHELVSKALDAGARGVCASLSSVYRWWIAESGDDPRDIVAVRRLFGLGGDVSIYALGILSELVKREPRVAAELVSNVEIGESEPYATSFASVFSEAPDLYATLTTDELRKCIMKFSATPRIDDWHIMELLNKAALTMPLAVLELLISRVMQEESKDVVTYTALPHGPLTLTLDREVVADPRYKKLLEDITRLYFDGSGPERYETPRVFVIAAGDMNATAVRVLRELSKRRQDAASIFVANCLRGGGAKTLVLSDATFVTQILDDAFAVGRETFDALRQAIVSCAVPRETTDEMRTSIEEAAVGLRDRLPVTSRARETYLTIVQRVRRISKDAAGGDHDDDG